MLETAQHCFTSAARCEGDGDEEEWLIHYMLGKVAEKQQQPPTVYLRHYRQASHLLHEEAARYPKKIHYHNPPELAMEALEVRLRWPQGGGGCTLPRRACSHPVAPCALLLQRPVPFRGAHCPFSGGASAPSTAAPGPCTCSLLPRCSGQGGRSQLGDGGAEEPRPSGPPGHSLACSSRADCVPAWVCVWVQAACSGSSLAHTWSTRRVPRTRCRPGGSWLPGTWGLSASPFAGRASTPPFLCQKAAGNLGPSLRVYSFFVFTYLLLLIVNDH